MVVRQQQHLCTPFWFFFFTAGNLWRWWRRKRERNVERETEREREREREKRKRERESQKSNFFLGLEIGLEGNK